MRKHVRHGLWLAWGAGTLGWVAIGVGLQGGPLLRPITRFWNHLLPEPNTPPGMPTLPAEAFYGPLADLVLPPLIVLLLGLILGWIIRSLWKA